MNIDIFKVDGQSVIEDINKALGNPIDTELKEKITEILKQTTFQENPVGFLYDWHSQHPNIACAIKNRSLSNLSVDEKSIVQIAKIVMERKEYVDKFCSFMIERAGFILHNLHPETDAAVISAIQKVFQDTIQTEQFKAILTMHRDRQIGNIDNEAQPLLNEKYLGPTIDDLEKNCTFSIYSPKPDIIRDHVNKTIVHLVKKYFNFTQNVNYNPIKALFQKSIK